MSNLSIKEQQEIKSIFNDLYKIYSNYLKKAYEYCRSENNSKIFLEFEQETINFFNNIEIIKVGIFITEKY